MQARRSEGAEISGLCVDLQVRLKLARQRFGEPIWRKKASFQSTKKAICTKEATNEGPLVDGMLLLWDVPASPPSKMLT